MVFSPQFLDLGFSIFHTLHMSCRYAQLKSCWGRRELGLVPDSSDLSDLSDFGWGDSHPPEA